MILAMEPSEQLVVSPRADQLEAEIVLRLASELERCPDLAFAHLPVVLVQDRQQLPEPVLFVWLEAGALRSLRSALNLVAEAVSRSLPDGHFLDVVVLNSAPELLEDVEAAGNLLVEKNPEERARALRAAAESVAAEEPERRPWWWPFSS